MTNPAHKINKKVRNFGSFKMLLRNLMFSFAKTEKVSQTALAITISITFMLFFSNSTDFTQKEAEILKFFGGLFWLFPVGAIHNCVFAISVSVHC